MCLALVGNNHHQLSRLENLARGRRDGASGYLGEVTKPSFAYLLLAARLVQVHEDVRFFRGEIRGRIVERDVSVFADAEKCDVDGCGRQLLAYLASYGRGISVVAVDLVKIDDSGLANQVLHQELAETCGVSDGQADVLVEVKGFDFGPVDVRRCREGVQEVELRCARGGDDAGVGAVGDRAADGGGGLIGSRAA